jgi:ABC-type uncharacterized transport system involved in gliding motility auxiliary subunit
VVVVADVDMLVDFTWVEQLNFFGQTVARPFANNGALVWNAVDNLAGSDDLVSIRARAPYSRPFDRVMDMRKNADAQLRVKQEQLQTELAQTEETINKLQLAQPAGNQSLLSADQARELDRFREQQLRIRKELRAVMAGVDSDIQSLGRWVKGINILLMPALVAGAGVLFWFWRRRRRQAIAMLNKGASA